MVGVLPDVPAVDRLLDYRVPARWAAQVAVGTVVRIPLQGRRVRGWVVALHTRAPEGVTLRDVSRVSGMGPGADLLELAEWAAHRWAGRRLTFLRAATPHRTVAALPAPPRPAARPPLADAVEQALAGEAGRLAAAALDAGGVRTLRWPPGAERVAIALAAVARGPALLLTPSQADADTLAVRLDRAGAWVARHPDDWAAGAAGATVVGGRAAAWAPVGGLAAVVVFDEHDARYQDERVPHWHAREVAVERARRAGVPVLLVSPVPSLPARMLAAPIVPARATERAGWPLLTVVDRRGLDPRDGLYPPEVVDAVRGEGRVVVVHNRTGRAKLLACTRCGELCRCERCGAAMQATGPARRHTARTTAPDAASGGSPDAASGGAGEGGSPDAASGGSPDAASGGAGEGEVGWLRCAGGDPAHRTPAVCLRCGATRLAVLRPGVSRVREELEALVGEAVEEVTAAAGPGAGTTRVVVGTEAVLHRVRRADAVVFLDFDQELLAPRLQATERALAVLALAARDLGGRRRNGRLVVATRQPDHAVLQAVLHADPDRWAEPELARRHLLQLPPMAALAALEGPSAAAAAEELRGDPTVAVAGPVDGRWLVKAPDAAALADALGSVTRPPAGLRIVVDPTGI